MKKTTREKRIWPLSPWTYDKKYFLTRVVECKKDTWQKPTFPDAVDFPLENLTPLD